MQKAKLDSSCLVVEYYNNLGPLQDYNTAPYEAKLSIAKNIGHKSNNKLNEVAKTITIKVSSFILHLLFFFFADVALSSQEMQLQVLAELLQKHSGISVLQ